jgi:integrase
VTLRYARMSYTVTQFRATLKGKKPTTITSWVGRGEAAPKGQSPRPWAGYIGRLVDIAGPDTYVHDLGPEHIDKLLAYYEDKPASYNLCLQALKAYLSFCSRYRYMSEPARERLLEGAQRKKVKAGAKRFLSVSELEAILKGTAQRHPVWRMVAVLAWYTALRQSEIIGLTIGQMRAEENHISVYRRKVDEWFSAPLSETLRDEIFSVWLPVYAAETGYSDWREMQADHPDWPLLPRIAAGVSKAGERWAHIVTTKGHPVPYKSGIQAMMHEALADAGIKKMPREGMHLYRRSAAMMCFTEWEREAQELAARGLPTINPLDLTSKMLGHKSPITTLNYLDMEHGKRELSRAMLERNPIDKARARAAGAADPTPLAPDLDQAALSGTVSDLAAFRARKAGVA